MRRLLQFTAVIVWTIGGVGCEQKPPPAPAPPGPPKPGWEYTREDFSVGHRHTANAACNRQIDQLLEEIRNCFNTHAPQECEALQKQNSKKMGTYIKSPRCTK